MKVAPRQIAGFLAKPDANVRAILVYGADRGLVQERVAILARTVVDDAADPFRTVELTAAAVDQDPAILADEAAALSLTGGRRIVRLRDFGNRQAKRIEAFLDDPVGDALILVDSEQLGPRDALRGLFEKHPLAAAIPCYADGVGDLEQLIRQECGDAGRQIDAEAVAYLATHLGNDRQVTRQELAKLLTFKLSDTGPITYDDAVQSVGDSAALALEDVAYACAGGEFAALERALTRSLTAGDQPIQVIRVIASHYFKLHKARGQIDAGKSADAALKEIRPPVHFSRRNGFSAQLRLWDGKRIGLALDRLLEAELDCKNGILPPETICRQMLFSLARFPAERRRRGR